MNDIYRSIKIGSLELRNNLFLAPMAGITDQPFRMLCKEQGCGMVYTEMVSAKAISFNNKKTTTLLAINEKEQPVGVQLFGSEPELIANMAVKIDNDYIAAYDVNMGCPVPKIVNNGEGSALMKDPNKVGEIVKALRTVTKKPVTIKIRKGFNDTLLNAVEIAKIAEFYGADAVTVHGRTREQYYSGVADWDSIKEVKKAVQIPVIGNGDVFTAHDAKALFEHTGCDGIMIARGARGNPWIFREISTYLSTGKMEEPPTKTEIRETIRKHMDALIELKGEYVGIREMRKHVSWYTKGLKHSAKIRKKINEIEKVEEFEPILDLIAH